MFRSSSADPAKLKKLTKILIQTPQIQLQHAMMMAKYSVEEIADKAFRRFLQRALPGGSLKGLKAQTAGAIPPPPDRTERHHHCTNVERTPPVERTAPPVNPTATNHHEIVLTSTIAQPDQSPDIVCDVGEMLTPAAMTKKRKQWNRAYYLKKRKSQHNHHDDNDNNRT